ncbi:uncharacterized protein ISCGN_029832 [Ixodes scapularis]
MWRQVRFYRTCLWVIAGGGDPGGGQGLRYKAILDTASKLTEFLWSSYVPQLKSLRALGKQHRGECVTLLRVPSLPVEVTKGSNDNSPKSKLSRDGFLPSVEQDLRLNRMYVPPMVKCECCSVGVCALIDTCVEVWNKCLNQEALKNCMSEIPDPWNFGIKDPRLQTCRVHEETLKCELAAGSNCPASADVAKKALYDIRMTLFDIYNCSRPKPDGYGSSGFSTTPAILVTLSALCVALLPTRQTLLLDFN